MQKTNSRNDKGCGTRRSAPFAHIWNIVSFLLFPIFFPGFSNASNTTEVRGLWVVRESIVNPEQVRRVVEFADALRFNVIFVQVRGRGDAYYRSALVPGPEGLSDIPARFDPLGALIPLAHARGIEVHAWFNVYLTWSSASPPSDKKHILNRRPEWFMASMDGLDMAKSPIDSVVKTMAEGRYLSPGLQPVRDHLAALIRETAGRYPIDGVHLDYVRYPGWNYDFHESVRRDFRNQHGLDPQAAVTGENGVDPQLDLLGKWVEYRADQVSRLVRDVSAQVRRVDPRIRVSAAVKPNPEDAYHRFGQDWPGWLRDGAVDFVAIMSYAADRDIFLDAVRRAADSNNRRKVVAGVGAHMISPEGAAEQITITRELGLLGFCVFSYGDCRDNSSLRESLKKTVRKGKTPLPFDFKPYLRKKI